MSMRNLGEHVLYLAEKHKSGVSNLQLQKVMFFALRDYYNNSNDPKQAKEFIKQIYDERFVKWPYGPVLQSEYFRYNFFGSRKIKYEGDYHYHLAGLDRSILSLLDENPYELVELSHQLPAWKDNKEKILARERVSDYTIDEILEEAGVTN